MDTITCPKCSTSTQIKDLRADKTGRGWVCINCYNRQHSKNTKDEPLPKPRSFFFKASEKPKEPTENLINREIKKITSYKCTGCNYKFETAQKALDKQCPYCGRYGCIEKIKTAAEILQAVDGMPDY